MDWIESVRVAGGDWFVVWAGGPAARWGRGSDCQPTDVRFEIDPGPEERARRANEANEAVRGPMGERAHFVATWGTP